MAFLNQNPILDEIDQAHATLSPPAQQAIALAHQGIGRGIPEGPQAPGATPPPEPAPSVAPVSAPRPIATPSAVRGLGPAPAPQDPAQTARIGEFNRLTAAPLSGDQAHTKADTGQSGIGQIHNPFARGALRVADALGSAFLPGLTQAIPGTELHHQMLVRHAEGNINQDETQKTAVASRAHMAAQDAETATRAAKEARPPVATNDFELWAQQNPEGKVSDWLKLKKDNAPEHNETAFDAWRKQNPNAPAEDWLKAEEGAKTHPPNEYADFKAGYLKTHPSANGDEVVKNFSDSKRAPHVDPLEDRIVKEYQDKHPGVSLADARKATQATPPADHGQNFVGADGQMVRVQPGQQVPQGAQTAAGVNSSNTVTSATKSMTEAAPKVLNFVDRIGKMVDQQQASLGPAASRWNEFMAGKVGAPNPAFTQLRTDVMLLQTALMRMHVGARGGEQMMQHFHDLIDVSKQSPENLRAALGEIKAYAEEVGRAHGPAGQQPPAAGGAPSGPPTVTTKEQFDALPKGAIYMEDGKQYRKP